jgi:hypothetical protein
MPEKNTFDYIDNDPLVRVILINPVSIPSYEFYRLYWAGHYTGVTENFILSETATFS